MSATEPLRDMSDLRSRRRHVRRQRYLFRVDVGLGLILAAVALVLVPGVAILAVAALLVLALCGVSMLIEHRRSRRR